MDSIETHSVGFYSRLSRCCFADKYWEGLGVWGTVAVPFEAAHPTGVFPMAIRLEMPFRGAIQ